MQFAGHSLHSMVLSEEYQIDREVEKIARDNLRFGPCDDDYEYKCPFVDILPEESETENGSPLNFKCENNF